VQFDVADKAAPGNFTVSFTGGGDYNYLSDASSDLSYPDISSPATITISSTPEPASWLLLAGGLAALGSTRWHRRRRT
jgi:MYXO-CTERM domain-containing protein